MNSAALVEGAGMAEIHLRKGEIRMSGLPVQLTMSADASNAHFSDGRPFALIPSTSFSPQTVEIMQH
jgi:hypothetical protein